MKITNKDIIKNIALENWRYKCDSSRMLLKRTSYSSYDKTY